jgi:hypothetical protein
MDLVLPFLIVFYILAFIYDKIIDSEIKRSAGLRSTLAQLKYFNALQKRPKALSAFLKFQFRGISTQLTVVGSIFSIQMYIAIIGGLYLISR